MQDFWYSTHKGVVTHTLRTTALEQAEFLQTSLQDEGFILEEIVTLWPPSLMPSELSASLTPSLNVKILILMFLLFSVDEWHGHPTVYSSQQPSSNSRCPDFFLVATKIYPLQLLSLSYLLNIPSVTISTNLSRCNKIAS